MYILVSFHWMICLAHSACLTLPVHEDDSILLRHPALWHKALNVYLISEKVHSGAILLDVRSPGRTWQTMKV